MKKNPSLCSQFKNKYLQKLQLM